MGCASSANSQFGHDVDGDDTMTDFFHLYRLGTKLGQGHYAQIRTVRVVADELTESNNEVVKILDLRGVNQSEGKQQRYKEAAQNEVDLLKRLGHHKHCVQLIGAFFCYDFCFAVMERCRTTLLQHMTEMAELDERSMGNLFAQMLSALAHVHMARIVHRDVKVENFLILGEDGAVVKLCDFGLSVALIKPHKKRGIAGTAPFMCPEMLNDEGYDEKADMWSLGVVTYVLLFGAFPYEPARGGDHGGKKGDTVGMKKAIAEGIVPRYRPIGGIGGGRSICVITFVKALLGRDPDVRPSAEAALQMPYMSMIKRNCYMLGSHLPCLKPMLPHAMEAGALEFRDLSQKLPVDGWLNMLQLNVSGDALPDDQSPQTDKLLKEFAPIAIDTIASGSTSCGSSRTMQARSSALYKSSTPCTLEELSSASLQSFTPLISEKCSSPSLHKFSL